MKGYRSGTRKIFSQAFRKHGMPTPSTYLRKYKRFDLVDIIVDPSIHKGMPYKYYHGKTGRIYNVDQKAVTVIVGRRFGNKIVEKMITCRIEHIRPSNCRKEFLERKSRYEELKKEAIANNLPLPPKKRQVVGPRKEVVLPLAGNEPKEIFYEPFYEVY
ncbi:60S ribosomal protein L21 [Tubulinosema ratisbonensis]|uniref:60S ribosomal protein L21 n=1 Tax=Tubulinosema ratisbonensis TaxID=291195 RepID=A0A437AI70_9MICR|nr:60S ribosomal protein L21 [Tubulinosema ratisbonensis]